MRDGEGDEPQHQPAKEEPYAVYERLRTDKTFIERLRTAPSFFEPPSADKLRPARAVEFLYQMVAIDTADASLCAKVSLNATVFRHCKLFQKADLRRHRLLRGVHIAAAPLTGLSSAR